MEFCVGQPRGGVSHRGRDRPCLGGGCGTERVREGLPVKIPISRSGGGGYFRGWLAKCDDLQQHGELGKLK